MFWSKINRMQKKTNVNRVNIKEGSCSTTVNNSRNRCVYEQTALAKHSYEHQLRKIIETEYVIHIVMNFTRQKQS